MNSGGTYFHITGIHWYVDVKIKPKKFWTLTLIYLCSKCEGGKWHCVKKACFGTCSLQGGTHMTTFDTRRYIFHGDCTYTLFKVRNSIFFFSCIIQNSIMCKIHLSCIVQSLFKKNFFLQICIFVIAKWCGKTNFEKH